MQIRTTRILLSTLTLCLSALTAKAEQVSVRLMGIETNRSDLYIKQGADFEVVYVPLYQNSPVYQLELEGRALQLYTKIETPEGPRYELLVEGKLPRDAESALGIYLIAPNGRPQLYFYSDDWSDFPKRSYRLINISPVVISSKIDEKLTQVQPLKSEVVKVGSKSSLPSVSVITVYKDENDQWKSIFDQRVPLRSDWRTTGIAVVTDGKLQESINPDYKVDRSKPVKSTLSFFSFTDDALTSAQRAAQRMQAQ
ncbi:hypothetical protein QEH52_02140 [Coraliomargarita sp. SDUM461003]|uniref:Uncharacterized protein n=1 Tax=Thalassobacterium maritimum TaxID=3041265 RepID=A0ABU1AQ73_9BACT|nr:hypothetical protein [Coraliomargarita sp. SDUM461003]MDQ8206290.1 hypothetical protein [Coraliomargarita sp. SDUM461003]